MTTANGKGFSHRRPTRGPAQERPGDAGLPRSQHNVDEAPGGVGRGECETLNATILTITLLTLASLPLASAGPGASVSTLDSDASGCAEESWSWSDGGSDEFGGWSSYGHGWSHTCSDDFRYATVEARDDQGELARATASSRSEDHQSGQGSWNDQWSDAGWSTSSSHDWAWGSSWGRGADLQTRYGSASGNHGCAWSNEARSQSWATSSYGHTDEGAYSTDGGASRCAADVSAAERSATVGSRCASHRESFDSRSSSGSTSTSSDATDCFVGAESSLASAGYTERCAEQAWGWSYTSGDSTETYDGTHTECRNGVVVTGPDGIVIFAGNEWYGASSCSGETCDSWGSSLVGARLSWAHNPLGPWPYGVFIPLS